MAGPKSQAKKDAGLVTAFSGYADGSIAPNIRTIGWRPGCECGHEDTVPATVLDCFAGSGTVGQVCRELPNPRRFVGLDLSGEYLTNLALARSEKLTPQAALVSLPMFAELAP